jgi:hypothetical protein
MEEKPKKKYGGSLNFGLGMKLEFKVVIGSIYFYYEITSSRNLPS